MPTTFCTKFGIDLPIVLAPMAGAVTPELVAAVSNAGGLGLAPVWHLDVDESRAFIRRVQSLTSAPFGVNLCMDFPSRDHLLACLDEGVEIVSLFWHQSPEFTALAKAAGAKVIFTAWDTQSAIQAVANGADAICAQGWEAGGHCRSEVATMALVPAVVDAVGDIPVAAAGGIADGRGLAAVLALGASAAWIGTRFLAAHEATIHPDYLAHIIRARESDTAYYENLFEITWPNAPHRVLKNSTTKMWEAAGQPKPGARPGEGEKIAVSRRSGDILRYQSHTANGDTRGDIEAGSMWAGQGVGLIKSAQPAADIIKSIADEARSIISF